MLDVTAIAGKVAGVISLLAFIPYIIAILRGKTKPNQATWLIWTVVGTLICVSYSSSGAKNTIWVPISYIIGPLIVAILSIKYGESDWASFDKYCLFGTGASVMLWWIFSSPLIALTINLLIDFMGVLPTIRKVYREPESEDWTAWVMFFVGNIINLFAIESWVSTVAIYPTYMFLANGFVTMLIFVRRKP